MRRAPWAAAAAAASMLACGGAPAGIIQPGQVVPDQSNPTGAVVNGAGMELTAAVEYLGAQLSGALRTAPNMRVAIADFPDLRGAVSDFSRFLSERTSTVLTRQRGVSVVERRRLDAVLAELNFSSTDLVDANQARQLGRLVGADAIVIGSVTDLTDRVEVDARIVEIESGNTLPGANVVIRKDANVAQLLRRGRRFPGQEN